MSIRDWADSSEGWAEKQKFDSDGIAVWTSSHGVAATVSRFGRQDKLLPDVYHFSGRRWRDDFRKFARTLDERTSRSCHAVVRCSRGTYQPWESIPLDQMVLRMEQDWFPAVLERSQLLSVMQPIWSLKDSRVYGFEALSRARSADREYSGGDLLDAAKVHNLLGAFDVAARRAAIVQGSAHLESDERLFVNILPSMIESPERDFAGAWAAAKACGVDPRRIVFEFVESEAFPPLEKLARIVGHIRERGAMVALDDFGAGHATLAMLDELRPDIVKFDRALIPSDPCANKAGLLKSLVSYSRGLGILSVAEGIESLEQLSFAEDCGFDLAQGWLIGRPSEEPVRPKFIPGR